MIGVGLGVGLGLNASRAIAVPELLSGDVILARLRDDLPDWRVINGQSLACTYQFDNFVEAIAFVNRLVEPAEAAAHHPDLTINYNRVALLLSTHDAGGLTELDFRVAQAARAATNPDGQPLTCLSNAL
ncbi:MAG: hypothetical protein Fur0046_35870 [Cyanobacteria bacterium J069]|nr:MAG: 4a-hydroxytetrahydrobiopterin dehydratase [Cyanobacteria bacterium J069]